ncbi:MAG: adenylate/guanylate cyclase domain-containing protein [Candidatus Omnitrophica bacterium]|nr:adenylate/guanylate cyclase domain-containing protein [Candidatus Omnitrophota bacterium]
MRKVLSYLIPALILFGVLALQYSFPSQIESFRAKVFDVFQMIKPRVYQDTPVRIIDIDDESLEKIGQWPWPRTILAKLVSRLATSGATVIAFDGVFPESDRTSPQNMLPLWAEGATSELLRAQLEMIPDHDTTFAEAISQAPVVLSFGLTNEPHKKLPLLKTGFLEHGAGKDRAVDHVWPVFKGAVVNLPVLEKAARGNGCFNMGVEWDQIVRRVPALFRMNDTLYPALVLETMRIFQGASAYKITMAGATGETSFGEKTGLVGIKAGLLEIPTDALGRIWLYDTGYNRERFIPAWKILEANAPLKELKEKVLFIGSSAMALKDLRATPLNPTSSGVEVQAQIVEQMFLGDFLERPDWAAGLEFTYLTLLGIFLILILPKAGAVRCAVIACLAIASAFGFSWYAFTKWHFLIDPVFPSFAVFLIYLVSSFLNFLGTEKERGQIRGAFGRYLSPALVERLAKNPNQLKLGGEMRPMTFLFMDIRNFTGIAEKFTPEELTHFMNSFLTPMTDIILQLGGTIDKYMGDCIMAFWNAPFEDEEHAPHACQAALEMQEFLRTTPGFEEIRVGIGINTGNACVGNMGSEQRFDYTALGDEVNLASRIEGLSKNYGVTAIVGQNTVASTKEFATLEIDLIRVKGKTKPVKIFALLGDAELESRPLFGEVRGHFEKMLTAYRNQRWDEAEKFLEKCRRITLPGIDLGILYELYISRLLSYKINPPAPGWDGVTIAESK